MLPNQWTAALPLDELDANPKGFELAGERLVAFADATGAWKVLLDRCPHRRSALSLGSVTAEGHLRCGYHGWRFDGAGHCTMIPLNDVKHSVRDRIRATALPTRVLAGALWVYTGREPGGEPQLPESLQGTDASFDSYSQLWNAHWTRAVENFIDFAHPPYVHRDTFGMFSYDYAESGGTARVEISETPFGCTMRNHLGGRSSGFQLDWYRPNLSCLHFGDSDYLKLHVISIPVTASQTRVLVVRRVPARERPAQSWRPGDGHPVLDEDRRIVESQQGAIALDDSEVSVASDGPSMIFRRWYRDLLRPRPA